jgi:cytochrome c-type biogenesis protein CcmE
MAQTLATTSVTPAKGGIRLKFVIGGVLILAAIVYMIVVSTQNSAQYFLTIQELKGRGAAVVGQNVRVSGAVIGDSIQYDAQKLELRFTVANVPGDEKEIDAQGGLAKVLDAAVLDPNAAHMEVIYEGVKPDLMKGQAQAIMDGHVDAQGVFHADTLLMKCPTRYESQIPTQAAQ